MINYTLYIILMLLGTQVSAAGGYAEVQEALSAERTLAQKRFDEAKDRLVNGLGLSAEDFAEKVSQLKGLKKKILELGAKEHEIETVLKEERKTL